MLPSPQQSITESIAPRLDAEASDQRLAKTQTIRCPKAIEPCLVARWFRRRRTRPHNLSRPQTIADPFTRSSARRRRARTAARRRRIGHDSFVDQTRPRGKFRVARASELRFEHSARRLVRSPWYYAFFVLSWMIRFGLLEALVFSAVATVALYAVLPRLPWQWAQSEPLSKRQQAHWDLLMAAAGLGWIALAIWGSKASCTGDLAAMASFGYLSPRLLAVLDL